MLTCKHLDLLSEHSKITVTRTGCNEWLAANGTQDAIDFDDALLTVLNDELYIQYLATHDDRILINILEANTLLDTYPKKIKVKGGYSLKVYEISGGYFKGTIDPHEKEIRLKIPSLRFISLDKRNLVEEKITRNLMEQDFSSEEKSLRFKGIKVDENGDRRIVFKERGGNGKELIIKLKYC